MMTGFIVNPSIEDDRDYYREDQSIVDGILAAVRLRVEGLRRSGKTSFLKRVQRATERAGKKSLLLDLRDMADEQDFSEAVIQIAGAEAGTILLVDELENAMSWPAAQLAALTNQLLRCTHLVVTAAPSLDPHRCTAQEEVHRLLEALRLHTIGALSDAEARNLLSQSLRSEAIHRLSEAQVTEILSTGDRLPLVLQALGEAAAGGNSVAGSLVTFGSRILSGLSATASEVLRRAAHGQIVSAEGDAGRLASLGALAITGGGGFGIRGRLLGEHIRYASPLPGGGEGAAKLWVRYARILHLSDLHLGPHYAGALEPDELLTSLLDALEREVPPDFVCVTGDLTWSGHPAELRMAEQFLIDLAAWLSRKLELSQTEARKRILVTPGNHEAAWSLSKGFEGTKDDSSEVWLGYCLAPFFNMVHRFYGGAYIWDLDCPCIEITFDKPSVSFLLLSSCYGLTQSETRGYFGDSVIKRATSLLNEKRVADARFRLGLWHHNLREFHGDGRVLRNVDHAIASFVQPMPGLDMALHGHVHIGEVDKSHPRGYLRPLPYSAVGSFGVRADDRPGDSVRGRYPNQFAFLTLEINGDERRAITQYFDRTVDGKKKWNFIARGPQPPVSL